jgi:hypothetical protein
MDPITRKLTETYLQMQQQATPGYDEAEDAAIKQPEIYATQKDANGNPVTDKHGNPRVISTVPVKKVPNIGGTHDEHMNKQVPTPIKKVEENFNLISGMSTIAPAAIAAGAFALPKILPRVIDRIRDAGKPSIIPVKSSVPIGPVGKVATNRDLDVVNQSNSARQHLENVEAQLARAEGRRPNPVTDEAVAKLVRSRTSAASGVMTRRENLANPYNLPRPHGNERY